MPPTLTQRIAEMQLQRPQEEVIPELRNPRAPWEGGPATQRPLPFVGDLLTQLVQESAAGISSIPPLLAQLAPSIGFGGETYDLANTPLNYQPYQAPEPVTSGQKAGDILSYVADPVDAIPLFKALGIFHGTPHKWAPEILETAGKKMEFPAGRPDLSKMGTGEGAQAYGWGFYGAEGKGTAGFYADVLGDRLAVSGHEVPGQALGRSLSEIDDYIPSGTLTQTEGRLLRDAWMNSDYTPDSIIGQLQRNTDFAATRGRRLNDADSLAEAEAGNALLTKLEAKKGGSLYELDLPDPIVDKMLDWDAPLSEQLQISEKLRPWLSKRFDELSKGRSTKPRDEWVEGYLEAKTGEEVYNAISRVEGMDDKAASEFLSSLGIPGNKYFDATSRGSGEGTRNFVLWDQDVLDKYVRVEKVDDKAVDLPRQLAEAQLRNR